ncbi:YcjF family protein [Adhaeretor mobilis]|uniref:GTPase Era n=1 Tax=Adhaeretor mobilis TaxID=1930276 RepID=A0A517N1T9_9BACT|nr:GTP-binding protein [Adhaeretor mobilis]QDT01097.1 GTPase Era [Adhaeretor mobilis]
MASPSTTTHDADYADALESVKDAVLRMKGCNEGERTELMHDLAQLEMMAEKLQAGRVEIVVFGEISTGKSALINAMIGEDKAGVNIRGGWTKDVWQIPWDSSGYEISGFADSKVVFVDTPGLNEVDGAERGELAQRAAERADIVLFVTDSDLNETEYSALVDLAALHKPLLLVLNKTDLYRKEELADLLSLFRGTRLAGIVDPEHVVTAQANPREMEYVVESADGSTRTEYRKPEPHVSEVTTGIVKLLQAEGKSLVALNAAIFAADKSDRMAAIRVKYREETAAKVIWSYATIKSLAVALNPVAVTDVLGGAAVDATMVVNLGKIYGIEVTMANARELITSILKAAGWVMLGEAVVHYTSSFFKAVTFGFSTIASAIPQGAAAGYGSYIVGQAARYYFQHGASWGENAPKQVVSQILANTDKESVLEKLKDEIREKIARNEHADR